MRVFYHLAAGRSLGEAGATAVEYALLVALIAAVIMGTVLVLGTSVSGMFQSMVGKF